MNGGEEDEAEEDRNFRPAVLCHFQFAADSWSCIGWKTAKVRFARPVGAVDRHQNPLAGTWRVLYVERKKRAKAKTVLDYVQRWAEGQPFRPFILRLEDGRAIPLTRPAHLACSDSGERIAVFLPDGSLEIIAQKSITSLQESRN